MQIKIFSRTSETLIFDKIMYVHTLYVNKNFKTETKNTIIKEVDLSNPLLVAKFFKEISLMQKSKEHRLFSNHVAKFGFYQFYLSNKEYPMFPIKWFSLILDDGTKIDHDIAFSTTLIKRNNIIIPFGSLFTETKCSRYRALNIKRQAYKYISNQINNSLK